MKRTVISVSGGMDSTALLVHLLARGDKVSAISFDYGQKHVLELERLQANLSYLKENGHSLSHTVLDLSALGALFHSSLTSKEWEPPEGHYEEENMIETVVPNRNAIFSSVAYGVALSIANKESIPVELAMGVHAGDHAIYPDCRPEFYESISQAFKIGNWNSEAVSFYLPFLAGDKETILQDALQSCESLGLDFDTIFANTNTSYAPDAQGRASGKTGSDVERILAFHSIGRPDPVEYVDPWETVLANALNLNTLKK